MTPKFPTTWPSSVANRQGALSYALFEHLQRVIFIQNRFFWSSGEIGNQARRSEGKISHGEFKNPPKKLFQKRRNHWKTRVVRCSLLWAFRRCRAHPKCGRFSHCFRKIKGLMMFRPEVIVHEVLTHSHEFFRTGRVNSHSVVKIRFCRAHFNSNSKTLDHFIYAKTNAV